MQIDPNVLNGINRRAAEGGVAAAFFQSVKEENAQPFGVGKEQYTKTAGVSESGSVKIEDATYGRPDHKKENKTTAEMLATDSGMSAEARRNQMAVLANTLSTEDLAKAQEDGYSLADMDSRTIVTVTDKIKAALAKAGVDISGMGGDLSKEELQEIVGSQALATQIAGELSRQDLPATTDNMRDCKEAYGQAMSLEPLEDQGMQYMLRNQLAPTIENLYLAQHSASELAIPETKEALSDSDYAQMQAQVSRVIEAAGLAVEDSNLQDAKWLLNNQIALTPENLLYLQQLKGLSNTLEQGVAGAQIVGAMTVAIAEGKRPQEAVLISGYSMEDKAQEAVRVIEEATEEDVEYVVNTGETMSVSTLATAERVRVSGQNVQPAVEPSNKELSMITARRQLEETRLVMTLQASYALLKKGINIDTMPLEELVENLKNQESAFFKDMLAQSGIEPTQDRVELYAKTTLYVEELKQYPASLLTIGKGEDTLSRMHESGSNLANAYAKAGERYELLMTAPRKDLGDDIRKAFRNVDDILEDMHLDITEENRRAVRILGYNNTEINAENIQLMKAKDEEVQRMFRNMTPGTTLEMIRRDINPLDMELSALNQSAEQIRSELGKDEESFSKFLFKLDQNKAITKEERATYIGIYRLFAQIEKTDGAVIGSLVNQGADLTLRNLLSAVRTGQKGSMNYKVDDSFDGVESTINTARIDEQIMSAYQTNLAKDIEEDITPAAFAAMQDMDWEGMTLEEFKATLEQQLAANPQDEAEEAYLKEQLSEFATVLSASEDVYTYLQKGDMDNSMNNVLAANMLLQNPSQMFTTLFGKDTSSTAERIKQVQELKDIVMNRYGEAVKTPEEMAQAQEELADLAENAMRGMILEQENISAKDLRDLRLMTQQFMLCAQKAKEENYVIPVETTDGVVTGISLKIVRGQEKKGFVDIMLRDELMGKVAASLEAKEDRISGIIATDDEETRKLLSDNLASLVEKLNDNGENSVDLRVAYVKDLSLEHFGAQSDLRKEQAGEVEATPVQTSRLYRLAESFIATIQEFGTDSIW